MEDEINLLDCWRTVIRRKKLIAIVVTCATLISIAYSLLATKIYRAEASILPIGGNESMSLGALVGQSGLGSLLGGLGQSTPSASLMSILESRTVAENIIKRFSLMQVFFEDEWDNKTKKWKESGPDKAPHMESAVKKLWKVMFFDEDLEKFLIKINGEFKVPQLSADVVNAYIDELNKFLNKNELTTAKRNRIFIEEQLGKNKMLVLETGKELSQFYGNNQISNLDPRLDVNVSSHNTHVESLSVDESAIKKLETKKAHLGKKIDQARLVKDVPQQIYLEYLTGYYQLLGQMNALLTQQYEMAKIDEAKEDISFQVIDWARVPFRQYKPKRTLIVAISFVASFLMAVFIAFFIEYLAQIKAQENENSTTLT